MTQRNTSYDNRKFLVNGALSDKKLLKDTIKLIINQSARRGVVAWRVVNSSIILYWNKEDGSTLFNMDGSCATIKDVMKIVIEYIKNCKSIGNNEPMECNSKECDVECIKGWTVFCESWGNVAHSHRAFCGIRPCAIWIGK